MIARRKVKGLDAVVINKDSLTTKDVATNVLGSKAFFIDQT